MIPKLIRAALGLFLLGSALWVAARAVRPRHAGARAPCRRSRWHPSQAPAAALPVAGQSPSPSGPVDPGTSKAKEAKETRVDYAPSSLVPLL